MYKTVIIFITILSMFSGKLQKRICIIILVESMTNYKVLVCVQNIKPAVVVVHVLYHML